MLQPPWLSAHFVTQSIFAFPSAPTSGFHRHHRPSGRAIVLCAADCRPPPCVKSQTESPSCRLHFPHWIGVVPSPLPPPPHRLPGPIKCTPASASLHRTRCSPPSLFSASPVVRQQAPLPPSPPLHRRPHPAIAPVTKARSKDRQDPLYLFTPRPPCSVQITN
jgi:hypothetical protein